MNQGGDIPEGTYRISTHKKELSGRSHLGQDGYSVVSSGKVMDEVIIEYVES